MNLIQYIFLRNDNFTFTSLHVEKNSNILSIWVEAPVLNNVPKERETLRTEAKTKKLQKCQGKLTLKAQSNVLKQTYLWLTQLK